MTTPTLTPNEQANYIDGRLRLEMRPGGSLHVGLSDLLSEAEGVIYEALGLDVDDPGEEWPLEHGDLVEAVAGTIADELFGAVTRYLAAELERENR